jgi:hypothetical protein
MGQVSWVYFLGFDLWGFALAMGVLAWLRRAVVGTGKGEYRDLSTALLPMRP